MALGGQKMTLLESALERKRGGRGVKYAIDDESMELALAWVEGDVNLSDISRALGMKQHDTSTVYCFLARALSAHVKKNGL